MTLLTSERPIYLINHSCYKPPDEFLVDRAEVERIWIDAKVYSPDMQQFQMRVHERSGLSNHGTYLPPAIHPKFCGAEAKTDLVAATKECYMAVTGAVQDLLDKTGLQGSDIDILVTTCSIFCPTPSMASMVVNHFKMNSALQSYHLGGMGCSNGAIGINLIHDILQARPNSNALFVTTETTTPAYYKGQDRSRQVTNMIFRMGAAAVLLSNKASWGKRIKYELLQHVRVHAGAKDTAFKAIQYSPDEQGINGIYLDKSLVAEANAALTKAMWRVAPHIMTWHQLAQYGVTWAKRRLLGPNSTKPYTPAFNESIQHFLIHAGGAKVLTGIGQALHLPAESLVPSNAVMHDYGNVSSSTTWYTLAFIETVQGVAAGDKILQIGLGSGVKVGVNVWQAKRDVQEVHSVWKHRLTSKDANSHPVVSGAQARGRAIRMVQGLTLLVLLALLAFLVWLHPSILGNVGRRTVV